MHPSRPDPERRHLNGRVYSLQSLTANVNGNLSHVNLRRRPVYNACTVLRPPPEFLLMRQAIKVANKFSGSRLVSIHVLSSSCENRRLDIWPLQIWIRIRFWIEVHSVFSNYDLRGCVNGSLQGRYRWRRRESNVRRSYTEKAKGPPLATIFSRLRIDPLGSLGIRFCG